MCTHFTCKWSRNGINCYKVTKVAKKVFFFPSFMVTRKKKVVCSNIVLKCLFTQINEIIFFRNVLVFADLFGV